MAIVRKHLQDVEDHSPTIDRIDPPRRIEAELSLRLLHFLSAEMNIPLSLPPSMPGGKKEEEENEEEEFFLNIFMAYRNNEYLKFCIN